jgi:hypothetical protein
MFSRRQLLQSSACGLGSLALWQLLAQDQAFAANKPEFNGGLHHRAKAKRVIQLFMNGGASQMDLFDYKPQLQAKHGEKFDPGTNERVEAATSEPGKVLGSPFKFAQHGQCGRWVSDRLPHLAKHVDEIAVLLSMTSKSNVHGPASYLMNTGFLLPGFPSFGAWVSYALGNLTENLPTFVVLPDTRGLPYNQRGNFSAGFLPVTHQGTIINAASNEPLHDLKAPANAKFITPKSEREGLALLAEVNREQLAMCDADPRLDARIKAYELAAKMQLSAPEVFDLSRETTETKKAYGLDNAATEDFGKRCLLARRMIERGVRVVQVWSGSNGPTGNWDNHSSIVNELPPMTAAIDQPTAALLADLKARGLLEDTLLLWNTEFGRMPFSQGSQGRDHNGGASLGWMAGAGVKPGVGIGETDEWSWKAVRDPISNYDLHATVLHLLGIDHEQLTYQHNGANRRLTDVHGHVIKEILA